MDAPINKWRKFTTAVVKIMVNTGSGKAHKLRAINCEDPAYTTLLISPYQNHELLRATGEELAAAYGVSFLYRDFRPGFRAGQQKARELGFYMQKYCGCVFSEEDRYARQIARDKEHLGNSSRQ